MSLTLRAVESGVPRTAVSEGDRTYRFAGLLPGRSGLGAALSGVSTREINDITIAIGLALRRDITMALQGVPESLTVTGKAPVAATTSTAVAAVVTQGTTMDTTTVRRSPASVGAVAAAGDISRGVQVYGRPVIRPARGHSVVTDSRSGQRFNLDVVNNTDSVKRDYKGLSVQYSHRMSHGLQLGGNYMLSFTRGNIEAENAASVTTFATANSYPECRQASWNYPYGDLNGDQRHKLRLWSMYELPAPGRLGTFDLGLMQRADSGQPYDLSFLVDTRPYVTNPGYLAPPSTVTYFASERGAFRFSGAWRTDLSLSWNHHVPSWTNAELFCRFVASNVFNNLALTGFNTTILGRTNDAALAAFNPFTTTPVEGANWSKGPSFGQATSPNSYQSPRDFNVSVGFRF